MPYDEALADRVRGALDGTAFEEKRMMGGLVFMLRGHICCGVDRDRLIVRLTPDAYARALEKPHVGPMDMTRRPITGFALVAPPGIRTAKALAAWVRRSIAFANSLPEKRRS